MIRWLINSKGLWQLLAVSSVSFHLGVFLGVWSWFYDSQTILNTERIKNDILGTLWSTDSFVWNWLWPWSLSQDQPHPSEHLNQLWPLYYMKQIALEQLSCFSRLKGTPKLKCSLCFKCNLVFPSESYWMYFCYKVFFLTLGMWAIFLSMVKKVRGRNCRDVKRVKSKRLEVMLTH